MARHGLARLVAVWRLGGRRHPVHPPPQPPNQPPPPYQGHDEETHAFMYVGIDKDKDKDQGTNQPNQDLPRLAIPVRLQLTWFTSLLPSA